MRKLSHITADTYSHGDRFSTPDGQLRAVHTIAEHYRWRNWKGKPKVEGTKWDSI
jgi:hypothetical protein